MKQTVVVADMKIGKSGDVLVTHALGSCLGLMVYDPKKEIGGLLHAMLPLSKSIAKKPKQILLCLLIPVLENYLINCTNLAEKRKILR